jgi:hypothetical protein
MKITNFMIFRGEIADKNRAESFIENLRCKNKIV